MKLLFGCIFGLLVFHALTSLVEGVVHSPQVQSNHPQNCRHPHVSSLERATVPLGSPQRRAGGVVDESVLSFGGGGDSDFRPLRIGVFYQDMLLSGHYCESAHENRSTYQGGTAPCTAQTVLTPERRRVIMEVLMPRAIAMHEERLLVARSPIAPVDLTATGPVCRSFTVPAAHAAQPVTDVDFILYVASGAGEAFLWGTSCLYGPDGRPTVGVLNVPAFFADTTVRNRAFLTHTIAHALGFDYEIFDQAKLVKTTSVRGKANVNVMVGPRVVAWAEKFYGCSDVLGMDFEDNPGLMAVHLPAETEGGVSRVGPSSIPTYTSDWKARNANDELMSSALEDGKYSALTLSAFADLGFYSVDLEKAEMAAWGRSVGCNLFTQACIQDGVSMVPSLFCTELPAPHHVCASQASCTASYQMIGGCDVIPYPWKLPPLYRYFSNPYLGGDLSGLDYCPTRPEVYAWSCATPSKNLVGGLYGADSRCLPATTSLGITVNTEDNCHVSAVCASVFCNPDQATYQVQVLGGTWTPCPEGERLGITNSPLLSGVVTCPPASTMCIGQAHTTLPSPTTSDVSSMREGAFVGILIIFSMISFVVL